jgi:TPR repeat protein
VPFPSSNRNQIALFRLLLKIALFAVLPLVAAAQTSDLVRLAETGNTAAQYALGVAYVNGDGVAADPARAAQWFEQAAKRGHVEARRQLMFMRAAGLIEGPAAAPVNPEAVYRIQVATVPSETDAEREWRRLKRRHGEALGPLEMDVVPFDTAEGGKLFRLQGGPLDEEGARAVCVRMREEGSTCLVIRP